MEIKMNTNTQNTDKITQGYEKNTLGIYLPQNKTPSGIYLPTPNNSPKGLDNILRQTNIKENIAIYNIKNLVLYTSPSNPYIINPFETPSNPYNPWPNLPFGMPYGPHLPQLPQPHNIPSSETPYGRPNNYMFGKSKNINSYNR